MGSLGGYHWVIVPKQSLRWFILDSEDGVVIVNLEDDPGATCRTTSCCRPAGDRGFVRVLLILMLCRSRSSRWG